MVLAYVLARIEAGKDIETLDEIKKLRGIKRAVATYGMYDLLIEVELENIEELDEFVFSELRKVPYVKETVTVITSRALSESS